MRALLTGFLVLALAAPLAAQSDPDASSGLEQLLNGMFDEFLVNLNTDGVGAHGSHFIPAAQAARGVLAPAMGNLIESRVSSFPASSTQLGVSIDFSSGQPVQRIDRLGPIFSESGGTIGRSRLSVGASYTFQPLDRIRGESLSDVEFQFTHVDADNSGLSGNTPFERDVIVVSPGIDVSASVFGLFATYGVSDRLDVGVAVPVISLTVDLESEATVMNNWNPNVWLHNYGGTTADPVATRTYAESRSETLVPSVTLRAKYALPTGDVETAAVLDLQIPTASESSLIGSGDFNARLLLAASQRIGRVNPHLNLGYALRAGDLNSDQFRFAAGFDANVSSRVNLVLDVFGEVDLEPADVIRFYDEDAGPGQPGAQTQQYLVQNEDGTGEVVAVPFSNIGDVRGDYAFVASIGSRFVFTRAVQGYVNALIPFASQGLQSSIAPSAGLSVYF